MKKNILFFILLSFIASGTLFGQTIHVSAPSHVATGENFQIAFTLNTNDIDDFRLGNVPDGLAMVAGPYKSSQSSIQMINGHTTSSASTKFTYTLYAEKSGTYTIGAARANINGKTVASSPIKIVVSGNATPSAGAPKMHDNTMRGHMASGNELFIRVSANKSRVYEQEPILLTYKVFTTQELTQLEGKMPDLKGFHTQEIPLPQQKSFHIETVNGKPYRCVTWSQYVMFPQMTGNLEIPSITFKGTVVVENKAVDPLEAFLNGGSNYTEIHKNIVAPSLHVTVDPLPKRPDNFSGGVGKFTISAETDKETLKTGDALTLKINVNGIGNIKLLKQPKPSFPTSFETYDPKVSDKTQLTNNGVEGSISYEYIAVPTTAGKFVIPRMPFCYFDTETKAYKTIYTDSITVTVEKGKGGVTSTADFTMKDKDIRPIKSGEATNLSSRFWGSEAHLFSIGLSIFLFFLLLVLFRKRAIANSDLVRTRNKKATRIANKRLKNASKLIATGNSTQFYDEVLRALWGYVSYKLDIATEYLSRDNIVEKLQGAGIEQQTTDMFVSSIDECEYMRYAPGDAVGNMQHTYDNAKNSIISIEETMKKHRKKSPHHAMSILFVMLIMSQSVFALSKVDADKQYKQGNYQYAAESYTQLLKGNKSPELYYNLGNAYYRMNNYAQAVLNYERALRLSPADNDILFNLQLAKSKTIDKIQPNSQLLITRWYLAVVHMFKTDTWAIVGIVALVLTCLLVLLYLFSDRLLFRQIGFYGAICGIILFFCSHLFAWQQIHLATAEKAGVITTTSQIYKSSSTSSEKTCVLHEGTKAIITDESIKGWYEVKFEDGNTGWIETRNIEVI